MASVNKTRPHCVNQMGKTHSKPLAARHGRGTAWAGHGHDMICVNRPLLCGHICPNVYFPTRVTDLYDVWRQKLDCKCCAANCVPPVSLFCMKLTPDFCELSQEWLVIERIVKDTKYM